MKEIMRIRKYLVDTAPALDWDPFLEWHALKKKNHGHGTLIFETFDRARANEYYDALLAARKQAETDPDLGKHEIWYYALSREGDKKTTHIKKFSTYKKLPSVQL